MKLNKLCLLLFMLMILISTIVACRAPAPTAPTATPSITVTAGPTSTSTPEPKHWISKMDPVEVLKDANMIPIGAKVEVALAPDGDGPFRFSAFGEYFVEEIPDRGVWAGEKGTDSLKFLIPQDLVGAIPDEGNVEIVGIYYDIEGKGGHWGVVQEVIRVEQP